jgi:hypothetical protein
MLGNLGGFDNGARKPGLALSLVARARCAGRYLFNSKSQHHAHLTHPTKLTFDFELIYERSISTMLISEMI